MDSKSRQPGVTSRLHQARGRKRIWTHPSGATVPLPLIVDMVNVDPETMDQLWRIEALVDLQDGEPALKRMSLESVVGLDVVRLQREFRWASPLEAVTRLVPAMINKGLDPFSQNLPLEGYPEVTREWDSVKGKLTDEFLEDVAKQYLELGRGYAAILGEKYGVSSRTATSWVEKARSRGILSPVRPGQFGGTLVPASKRRRRRS